MLDYTVEPVDPKTPNVRHIRINQDSITQGLTEVQWLLSGRNPHATLRALNDRALITISEPNTRIYGSIKAKNGCGEKNVFFEVNP